MCQGMRQTDAILPNCVFLELWLRRSQVCGHNVTIAYHLCQRDGIDRRVIENANQEMKLEASRGSHPLPVHQSELWSTWRNYNSSRYASIACTLESDLNCKFSAESEQLQKIALQLLANLSNQGGHCVEALWSALYAENLATIVERAVGITWINPYIILCCLRTGKEFILSILCYL